MHLLRKIWLWSDKYHFLSLLALISWIRRSICPKYWIEEEGFYCDIMVFLDEDNDQLYLMFFIL